MKNRFSSLDICGVVVEIRKKVVGMRVNNVYDIDNKTYLLRFSRSEEKLVVLIESGIRLHLTDFDWPKSMMPSGFSMKLRKHLNNKRLEKIEQIGLDRIVVLTFGSGEAAYHLVVEMYDKGNMALTDHQWTILNILRPRVDVKQQQKFSVREVYQIESRPIQLPGQDEVVELLESAKSSLAVKKVLPAKLTYGAAVLEHCLRRVGVSSAVKVGDFPASKVRELLDALDELVASLASEEPLATGYLLLKDGAVFDEFHPFLYDQHKTCEVRTFPSFSQAVDEFYSKIESNKLDSKAAQQEKSALSKLDNIKKDHQRRLDNLTEEQLADKRKAEVIESNLELVDAALQTVRQAVASQLSWDDIEHLLNEAKAQGDPVAKHIVELNLDVSQFTMALSNWFADDEDDDDDDGGRPLYRVEIDLSLSAYSNVTRYHDKRRYAAQKEDKTKASSAKALKSAEVKTKQMLRDVQVKVKIDKTRKPFWFEKFFWFISSENYLVIGGRDQQQNEVIVRRYLRAGDVYVHADIHGATSVVVKNPSRRPIPPRTLSEAGVMAVCHSAAWEARITTDAWWVYDNQVSKTAPTGEYLTTGSFMIRGKKNYIPKCPLVYGFSVLFKLDESCVAKHLGERKSRAMSDVSSIAASSVITETEIDLPDDVDDDDDLGGGGADDDDDNDSVADGQEEDHPINDEADMKADDDHDARSSDEDLPDEDVEPEQPEAAQVNVAADDENSADLPQTKAASTGKRHLSAKEKRQLRKERTSSGSTSNAPIEPANDRQPDHTDGRRPTATANEPTAGSGGKPANVALKRGQKGKLRKIKQKYANQDEEEREVRMRLLASAGTAGGADDQKKRRGKKPKGVPPNVVTKAVSKPSAPAPRTIIYHDDNDTMADSPVASKPPPTSFAEEDQMDEADEADDAVSPGSGAVDEVSQLVNTLTGSPLADDILLFPLAVCAPYSALQSYKHKVKLMPGTNRRGKALKTALHLFSSQKDLAPAERQLLRALKDADLGRDCPGKKVKVMVASQHK